MDAISWTVRSPRKKQANTAIDTFHKAEAGDAEAMKDLMDQKRELLGEEPSDRDIFQTLLENQSRFYDNDTILDVALSDNETQQSQDVLDLYKEFRGYLANVDEAINPKQQIDLFIEITKGNGALPNHMFLEHQSLTVLTANGTRILSVALKEFGILGDGTLLDISMDKCRQMASSSEVKTEYA
ncbi:MAG: hypothetical protein JKY17_08275 [Magnetovibrio sp.]|nr:hypothetical protein [Magnetovibrio sp.]